MYLTSCFIPGDVLQEVNGTRFRFMTTENIRQIVGDESTNWLRLDTSNLKVHFKRPNLAIHFDLRMVNGMRKMYKLPPLSEHGQLNADSMNAVNGKKHPNSMTEIRKLCTEDDVSFCGGLFGACCSAGSEVQGEINLDANGPQKRY